jgi:hypothetical protein
LKAGTSGTPNKKRFTRERKRIAMMGKNIGKGRYYKKELI